MFELKKWDHNVEEGIYKVSAKVKSYSQIKPITDEMVKWLNENNGKFHPLPTAYAISHCQVEADPLAFFVTSKDLIGSPKSKEGRNTFKNYFFPSQIIVNAQILQRPEKIKANKPKREMVRTPNGIQPKITITESEETNIIGVPEACMSFPNKKQKTVKRYYRVKVRYQYPVSILGVWYLKTRTEWVDGLKAHIFQHEVDHQNGKNMYYNETV